MGLARERIELILERADESGKEDIDEAVAIAKAHNVSIPGEYSMRICDGCSLFLHPGKNASVRVSGGIIRYKCGECGTVNRHGY